MGAVRVGSWALVTLVTGADSRSCYRDSRNGFRNGFRTADEAAVAACRHPCFGTRGSPQGVRPPHEPTGRQKVIDCSVFWVGPQQDSDNKIVTLLYSLGVFWRSITYYAQGTISVSINGNDFVFTCMGMDR